MKKILLSLSLACACALQATNVTYTADNSTDFPNPERGFYDHSEWTVTNKTSNLDASDLTSARNQNRTLLLRLYYLSNYRKADLPSSFLTQFTNDMAKFRQNGCKAIIRFAYDNNMDDGYQDASLTYWKRHLDQLKQVLNDNADVIYVVQAGFMGVWGEWYYSSAGTGSQIPATTKTQLIDKLLECVPASRCVQLRTPKYKRDYTGYTAAMSASDAYQNTARARLGHHNDAFLNGESNSGTYENRTADMNYLATECLYVPNGGENNIMDVSSYNTWGTGAIAKAEMAQLHYSYMNSGYSEVATDRWKNDGSFNEMSRNLGYRYQLTSAVLPSKGTIGKVVNVQLNIKNVGYAPLYNERHAYIVFKNGSKTYTVQLASDPRTWLPNGATTAINENITLPSNMTAGTYTMYLWLPDASASIANDSKFAVRFANSNVWESSTGYNKLNASIVVSATGGDEPGPTPTPSVDPISNLSASAVDAASIALTWTNPTGSSSPSTEALALTSAQAYASSGTATPGVNGSNLVVNYSNVAAWEVAGVQFALASRSDVASISYTLTGNGQDVDFIAYVKDAGDAQWYEDVKNLSSTTAATYTMTPANQLWTDKSHAVGSQPYTMLYFVANPSQTGSGSFTLSNITLNLIGGGSVPAQFTQVKIVRKVGAAPASVSDGTVVYTGNAQSYTDTELSASTHYYYAAYSYNNTAVSTTVLTADATTQAATPGPGPTPVGDAISLPGSLLASAATLSGYTLSGDAIELTDPEHASDAYALWPVQVLCTGNYNVSALISTTNGYKLEFYLLNAEGTPVAQLTPDAKYGDANFGDHKTIDYGTIALTAGTYTFKLVNNLQWTEAKVHAITLSNPNCSTPTALDAATVSAMPDGKYLQHGQLLIRHRGTVYNMWGQAIHTNK